MRQLLQAEPRHAPPASPPYPYPLCPLKRAVDVALALVAMVVTAPLWALVPLAIWLEDRGPVFYSQQRVGLGGRLFRLWKFRSMRAGAEGEPVQAAPNDGRFTRTGRLLRRTALDEMPQLWNILKGDMSFVGPRALCPSERLRDGRRVSLLALPGADVRHLVRPGLTGPAQVFAERDLDPGEKFHYDLFYVSARSLSLDLWLVVLSLANTLRGRWPV